MSDPSAVIAKEISGAPDPMIGRIIDGRYLIHSLVAIGGMGRVYKAEQSSLGRTVAIKTLLVDPVRQAFDPHFRERFAREAAMASRLTSPNTITIFHYGRTDDDIYYIVMEYVEGITLGRLLKSEGPLSPLRAITIAGQVCLSLREAHARGIVHRDIKPGNIMLIDGDYEQVKVLDFGIAKHLVRDEEERVEELTSSRSYVGTPEYMAPECFHGGADRRSDIYSVGVMLYVSVTGRLPFKGKTATQTILLALHEPPPAIDPALRVPRALGDLIFACLAKDPDRRPSSVDQVLHALQLCLADVEKAAYRDQALMDADADAQPPAEDPLKAASLYAVPSSFAGLGRSARKRVAKGLFAAAALLAIGIATALIFRFARGEGELGASGAPSAEPSTPTPPAAKPVSPPAVTPFAFTVKGGVGPAAGAAVPAPVRATDKPETAAPTTTGRRTRRNAGRVRSDRPARAAGVRAESPKSEREPSPTASPNPEDPVPDGYKPSPY